MKALKYLLFAIIPLFVFSSCENDDGENPSFADDEVPRIFMDWQEYTARQVGDVLTYTPIISPSDGATYKWTLDGKVISTEKDLSYTIAEEIIGVLEFEVTRKDATNTRTTNLLVPRDFEPKTYNKKSIAFVTGSGAIRDIDWENITHLVVSSAVVNANGSLDESNFQDINLSTMITYAHHYGVYIILEVSGELNSYVNAVPKYESYNFYNNAIAWNYQTFADNIVAKVKELGVDGLNVYMDKAAGGAFGDPAALATFYTYLGDKMKAEQNTVDGNDYDYILSMSVVGGWTRGSLASCVNIPAYDWVNILAFAAEDLAPGAHSAQWYAEQEVNTWLGWQGPIAPSRVVLAVPAFGLRYFGIPANYTWANLESFTEYIPYKTICSQYADAPSKTEIVILDNGGDNTKEVNKIYYDNPAAIEAKANFALSKNLAGMALWSIENDSKESGASLIKKMNEGLGN